MRFVHARRRAIRRRRRSGQVRSVGLPFSLERAAAARPGVRRFVIGALNFGIDMMIRAVLRRWLMRHGGFRSGSGMSIVVPGHLAFLIATQPSPHLPEQRAYPFAGGLFDRPDRLNLCQDFENLGVHVMYELLVGRGSNRVANRLWIGRTARDAPHAAGANFRRTRRAGCRAGTTRTLPSS